MIPKQLNDVLEEDLVALITNGVAEGRSIDYKRDLPGGSDGDKKEFLADASSFANTSGGDLVFGMLEAAGLPTQITGVQAGDLDIEVRRLDSILAAGLSPRIRYSMKVVTTANVGRVLIIRVERSWGGPHRMIFQGHDKFYGRNSAGKYPLDVNELRTAFTLSSSVTDRVRAFRTDRIIALSNNETPLPFMDSPKVVMHCVSLEAFASGVQYDVLPVYHGDPGLLIPMGTSVWDRRLNLDGVLAFGSQQPCPSYTQLYRTGVVEVVQGRFLAQQHENRAVIPSVAYERYILQYLPQCFRLLEAVGANAPVIVGLTLTRTKGLYMGVDNMWGENGYPIDAETLILPEVVVESFLKPANQILKPLFDLVWNACGFPFSTNFDTDGNWITRR